MKPSLQEQGRELQSFDHTKKEAQNELKRQVAAQFSDRKARQTTLRARKTQLDSHQKYKESAFKAKQDDKLNEAINKFAEDQKKTVAETERNFLVKKQVQN